MGNIPLAFVNEDLGNHSHGVREEGFPPIDHGKRTLDVGECHHDCALYVHESHFQNYLTLCVQQYVRH